MAELLAPAGAWPQLRAAVRFGADAVYLGGTAFGLRAFAGNFDEEELPRAVAYCHAHQVKVYVTLNAFLYDDDLAGLARMAAHVRAAGADAVIVADPAAVEIVREVAPRLPLHISTQANTLNARTAAFWYRNGAQRIVLARELSLERIAHMRDVLPEALELEGFVHGAVCVSYSGRCVLSNYLAGRDANQGACAQACRWNYALVEEKRPGEYMPVYEDEKGTSIYSAHDLCMIEHIDDVLAAGVSSLKIEGRMKTDYYVATVVGAYRAAVQNAMAGKPYDPRHGEEVRRASHRQSTTGFYFGPHTQPPPRVGYQRGADYCATILQVDASGEALLEQRNKFSVGEELTLLTPQGAVDFTLEALRDEEGLSIGSAPHARQRVRCTLPAGAQMGDFVRRERAQG